MARPKNLGLWHTALGAGQSNDKDALLAQRKALLTKWSLDPCAWIFGVDPTTFAGPDGSNWPDGVPLIWTTDERDRQHPIKPIPDKPYLRELVSEITNHQFVLIHKCRQMMASWTILLIMDWECRTQPARRHLLSRATEEDAIELLTDKVAVVQERLPEWIQDAWPQVQGPANRIKYPQSRSYIKAVTENAAVRACRGGTASRVFIDEAAFQDRFGDIIAASLPMSSNIVACTTPNLGNPGAEAFRKYIEEVP